MADRKNEEASKAMLADLRLITPIRQSTNTPALKRRREEQHRTSKVHPRRQAHRPEHQDNPEHDSAGLSRYA
jgi:hypothetical protein